MKKFLSFKVFLFFLSFSYANEVVLTNISGNVLVYKNKNWQAAKVGLVISSNEAVKTFKNSKVQLVFSDGSLIILTENSELTLRKCKDDIEVYLKNGKISTKVKPVKIGQKFEIHTDVSVASIRGTEFILEYLNNVSKLIVIEGKVLFSDMFKNQVEVNPFEQCQANQVGLSEKSAVSEDLINNELILFKVREDEKLDDKGSKVSYEETKIRKDDLSDLKQELKDFIKEAKTENFNINEIVQQTKENDFSAGRTLIDVNGNLTRVEQTVSRPEANVIEFMNITKRENYTYKDRANFNYDVENKARVDLFSFKMEFNMDLPTNINEFPYFISQNEDNLYVKRIDWQLVNIKEGKAKDGFYGHTNTATNKDDKLKMYQFISNDVYNDAKVDGGYMIDTEFEGSKLPEGREKDFDETSFWGWAEKPIAVIDTKTNKNDILWLQTEAYIIDNSGKILSESYFKNSSKDPFTLLKDVAIQSIVFVRHNKNNMPAEAYFSKNIDLVSTPDIIIALVRSVASEMSKINLE